jgi:hypothetical protein
MQLWPVSKFATGDGGLVIIGSDSEAADVVVNTRCKPAVVETWCAFGGAKIRTLSTLSEFLAWMLEEPRRNSPLLDR